MGKVLSVSKHGKHSFSKPLCDSIVLLDNQGVEGDAHCGETVKHRSRVKQDPAQPNLRQVHLLHYELLEELKENGFTVGPGSIGENITTVGIDLLGLPRHTRLAIGNDAVIEVTGLRNPCAQLEDYQSGLLAAVLDKDEQGNLIRKAGIMAVVVKGGEVNVGDTINTTYPAEPYLPLERV